MANKNTWRDFAIGIGVALAFGVVLGIITYFLGIDLGFFGYVIAFAVAYAVWEIVKYLRKNRSESQGSGSD